MHKRGIFGVGMIVICLTIYILNTFFLDISCSYKGGFTCESDSQAQAEFLEKDILSEENIGLFSAGEAPNPSEAASAKALEKKQELLKKQIEAEQLKQEKEIYKAQLHEDAQVIVSRYEAERQKNSP